MSDVSKTTLIQTYLGNDRWGWKEVPAPAPPAPAIQISARLYQELKEYLAMETDIVATQLLRRLRESVGNG